MDPSMTLNDILPFEQEKSVKGYQHTSLSSNTKGALGSVAGSLPYKAAAERNKGLGKLRGWTLFLLLGM